MGLATFYFVNVFSLFRYYLPLGIDRAHHLNTLKSLLLNDALCLAWLKLAQWLWRRGFKFFILFIHFRYFVIISLWKRAETIIWRVWSREEEFFYLVYVISLFRYYLPLGINRVHHVNTHKNPFTQRRLLPSLVEIGPVVLEKMKIWKVYRRMEDGHKAIRKAHLITNSCINKTTSSFRNNHR